ncbi:hypothetical protein COW46_03520 [Candidatus Gracilibacteria bacterium CG17_big_fil_post_rev_8_21_14_2_50_48_13]|nr:MAG: hypothetical protein COW46_03520 [Candidatus Gracilibacteria bacterium CG17_big_fil_post_rev_8_21_14_2_50_48_13]
MKLQKYRPYISWGLGLLLLAFYVMSLYQRGNLWRFAPELRIAVMSEPLYSVAKEIVGDLAMVQQIEYPLTSTGTRLEHLLSDTHIVLVPRAADAQALPLPPDARVLSMEDVFSPSFQYQLLRNNRQFFAYAQPALEDRVVAGIRDKLVDVDVVRAGKYEVAAKAIRRRIKATGGFLEESQLVLPTPDLL